MKELVDDWLAADKVDSVEEKESDEGALVFQCAHCGHPHPDPFEVLDLDVIAEMHCEQCEKRFSLVLVECLGCGHEDVFTWEYTPGSEILRHLTCQSCGRQHGYEDDGTQAWDILPS